MALPTSGQISLSSIKNEFGPNIPNVPVNISSYYKGAVGDKFALVRNTGVNIKVPTSGTISLSSFRGAVKYVGSVGIYVVGETPHQYGWNNDGYVVVGVYGNSPSYYVSINGSGSTLLPNQTTSRGGYDSSSYVSITVTDTSGTYNFGPYNIGYGGSASYSYAL